MSARSISSGGGRVAPLRFSGWRAGDWLTLAAAPTFAALAVHTGHSGGGTAALLCGEAHESSLLTGMTAMYGLMAIFHLPPWLKLASKATRRVY